MDTGRDRLPLGLARHPPSRSRLRRQTKPDDNEQAEPPHPLKYVPPPARASALRLAGNVARRSDLVGRLSSYAPAVEGGAAT